MNLSEIGELGLIERLRAIIGPATVSGEVWSGDDAAVVRAPSGTMLFTTDLLVEGIHFDVALTSAQDLGYKALTVNASDVAAMGGVPRKSVIALGLPPSTPVEWVEQLYEGVMQACREYEMTVVGGDISAAGQISICVAMIGSPAGRRVIERNSAVPGDLICVTGVLGAAAAGRRLLEAGEEGPRALTAAFLRPKARVAEVEILRRFIPTAMIDVSDGLATDLNRICVASAIGAIIDVSSIPLALDAEDRKIPLELALGGGEDYEILFTIAPERAGEAAQAVFEQTTTRVSVIGECVGADRGVLMKFADGARSPLAPDGWDHFK